MTTKKAKGIIERHSAFNRFYADTGEDYAYALELWMPRYYELVEVFSEEDADQLMEELNELN